MYKKEGKLVIILTARLPSIFAKGILTSWKLSAKTDLKTEKRETRNISNVARHYCKRSVVVRSFERPHITKGAFLHKKIQDWILNSERIRKRIFYFFTKQINLRSLRSWCVKGTKESTLKKGFFGSFDAQWSERSWIDLFSKETQNPFSNSFGFFRILDFLKEMLP